MDDCLQYYEISVLISIDYNFINVIIVLINEEIFDLLISNKKFEQQVSVFGLLFNFFFYRKVF
jgi:hypothetical protein